MPDSCRREIIIPSGVEAPEVERLIQMLSESVRRQQYIARDCPTVLKLTSDLQQDGDRLFVEHEPAEAWYTGVMFDPKVETLEAADLLVCSLGMFSALHHAHQLSGQEVVHGGLCPGVVLRAPNGSVKISDFGFSQAIASACGTDHYSYLVVDVHAKDPAVTARWEVVSADHLERDDRLCGFIAIEKYPQRLTAFEAGSDIFSAGMVSFVLANQFHPYLLPVKDAHRIVQCCEYMSSSPFLGDFREDLAESDVPEVGRWRDVILQTLNRSPSMRPKAGEVVESLGGTAAPGDTSGSAECDIAEDVLDDSSDTEDVVFPEPNRVDALDSGNEEAEPTHEPEPVEESPPEFVPTQRVSEMTLVSGREGERRTHLFGLDEVHMGRNKAHNDIVLRVFPLTPVNARKSRQISGSKPHLRMSLRPDGVYLEDLKSTNGTRVNGQDLTGTTRLGLDNSALVDVGKALRLEIQPLVSDPQGASDSSYDSLGPPDELWQTSVECGITAVQIRRQDRLVDRENYLMVYRWVDLSFDRDVSLWLPRDSIDGPRVRILRRDGRLWIHSMPGTRELSFEGQTIGPEPVELSVMSLIAGESVETQVVGFEQLGMY
jgi:serine/threonine protein kinase